METNSPLSLLRAAYSQHMCLTSDDIWAVDFFIGIVASQRLGSSARDQLWGFLVGPSSSGKTEFLMALLGLPWVYQLDKLTPKTLISHYNQDGEDHSLLPIIKDKVVVFSDFTTMMQLPIHQFDEILGDLRSMFDPLSFRSTSGVASKRFDSRFGMLAGTTPVVDTVLRRSTQCGERFLKFRINRKGRLSRSQVASILMGSHTTGESNKAVRRKTLAKSVATHLAFLETENESFSLLAQTLNDALFISSLARVVSSMRAEPSKGPYGESFENDPEVPTRFGFQCQALCRARCLLDNRADEPFNSEDYTLARRVAWDTLPVSCSRLMARLANPSLKTLKSKEEIARIIRIPLAETSRVVDQLVYSEVLQKSRLGYVPSESFLEDLDISGIMEVAP